MNDKVIMHNDWMTMNLMYNDWMTRSLGMTRSLFAYYLSPDDPIPGIKCVYWIWYSVLYDSED